MEKSLLKDSIRQIKNTLKRFLSIVAIVLLGVGFFAGITATSPDMKDTVDKYFDDENVMDIEIISTLGLTDEDIEALKQVEGTKDVVGTYSIDATFSNGKKEYVVKIESMPNEINNVILQEGNLPQNANECVVESSLLTWTGYKIGDYITLNPQKVESSTSLVDIGISGDDEQTNGSNMGNNKTAENDNNLKENQSDETNNNLNEENSYEDSTVKNKRVKIVGTVQSPLYISRSRGSSKLGSGSVNYYMYMPKENFNMDVYTIAYISVDGAKDLKTYSDEYKDKVKGVIDNIEDISDERKQARYNCIVNNAQSKLDDAQKEYDEQKQKAEDELQDAQEKLNDAKTQIAKIEKPTWYILDRNSNYGYAEYIQDTDRIGNLAKVFPIVFFLVAALISLTSMSRMIEEQRVQIGTLKALGYNKIQISFKYIIYAFLATIIGGIAGMIIGFKLLPAIITMMYGMMYTLPKAECVIRMDIGMLGLGFALICTLGATIYTCVKELKEKPAELMLPKAPKPGKRIMLEKITFIWKRLKFTNKVTARNVFRYKKKMLMTVIGVAGCTSLIIAGFGIRNAIGNMIPNQYGEIFKYDGTIEFKDDVTKTQIQEENEKVKSLDKIEDTLPSYMKTVEITSIQNSQTINLVVPEQTDRLNEFIGLRSRKHKKETYTLDDESVIISEKIANLLKIKVGDTITIKNTDDIEKDVKVGAITENYIYHFMYMSSNLYNKLYGENTYKPNTLLIKEVEGTTEDDEETAGKTILKDDTVVAGVSFLSRTKDIFADVMDKMQLVVYILIISAGLLAFAVLYNLSNVNISERIRELATIKVLGFYDKEVFNYITKETRILTVLGIFLGLFGGYFLSMFAVKTCELDMIMFNYDIGKMCFIYGIAITIIFAEIVNLAVNRTLKKISMTESLKSVD